MKIKNTKQILAAIDNKLALRLGRTMPYPDAGIPTDADIDYVASVKSRTLAIYDRMRKNSPDGTFPMALALVMGEIEITKEMQ